MPAMDICRNPEGKPPRFPQKPTISQKGEVLSMECILEALPVADITWFHGQDSITDGERFKILRKAISSDTYLLTLQISQPSANDGGIYRCHAFNPFGESNAHITLNFKGIILLNPENRIKLLPVAVFGVTVCFSRDQKANTKAKCYYDSKHSTDPLGPL